MPGSFGTLPVSNEASPMERMIRNHLNLAVLCLLLVLQGMELPAQTVRSSSGENYTVDIWDVSDGLPQGTVTSLAQSADGYLWFGTNAGLVRFDGMRFRTYERLDPGDMRPHAITALVTGNDSSVWVGTLSGDVFLLRRNGWNHLLEGGGAGHSIRALTEDENGIVWIGTASRGLLRAARTQNGSDTILTSFVQPDFMPEEISALHVDPMGALWLGGPGGLATLIGTGIRTYRFTGAYKERTVAGIGSDTSGRLWVAFPTGEVCRFDPSVQGYLDHRSSAGSFAFDEAFDAGRPYIALGVLAGGLVLREGNFVATDSDPRRSGDRIVSLYKDKEGNHWFGSFLRGLIRVRPAPFEMIKRDIRQSITSIYRRANGDVFVGLNCGGVGVIRQHALEVAPLSTRLPNDCVWSLFVDDRDRLWVGTWGGGVFRFDLEDPATRVPHYGLNSFVGSDVVLAIAEGPDGALWFGTYDAGVVRLKSGRSRRWTTSDGMPGNDVRAIAFDSVGGVWIGTHTGLALIQDSVLHAFTSADGLTSGAIRTITTGSNGAVWIGTEGGGLLRFRNGMFRAITTEEGMFDNTVSHILEGVRGFVWMGSNRGIWRVAKDELNAVADGILPSVNSIAYGKQDGLTVVETNGGFQPGALQTADGDLYFPTMDGVARIRTERLRVNSTPPPVIIERIMVDGEEVPRSGTIAVSPGAEEVEITYTALSFTAPEKVRFRYQLSGFNKTWVDAGDERTAVFTNIPPGTYVFSVTAANNDGFWNEEGSAVTIVVQTPFWETVWFRGLAILMLIGMGMLVVSVRLRQVRRQKEMQEETSQRLIQSQEEERQRIAGELHDSLGQELIVAKNRVMLAAHHLPEESKARSELTQVAEALSNALKSVRSIAYNLRPFQLDRLGLTETITSTVRTIQQATNVRFETEIENIDGLLTHEGEIGLFRVVQEALTNVVKHSEAKHATVVVTRDENAVVMRVSDDGVGFEHDADNETMSSMGFGLPGMTERVRLLRGMYKISSAPGKGTTVAVRLPVQKHIGDSYG